MSDFLGYRAAASQLKIATLYNRQNFDILEGMSIISIWQDILNHIH